MYVKHPFLVVQNRYFFDYCSSKIKMNVWFWGTNKDHEIISLTAIKTHDNTSLKFSLKCLMNTYCIQGKFHPPFIFALLRTNSNLGKLNYKG